MMDLQEAADAIPHSDCDRPEVALTREILSRTIGSVILELLKLDFVDDGKAAAGFIFAQLSNQDAILATIISRAAAENKRIVELLLELHKTVKMAAPRDREILALLKEIIVRISSSRE